VKEIAVATAKTDLGYSHPENCCYWWDDTPLNNWRNWAPSDNPAESTGAMYWNINHIETLVRSSPSGQIVFPEFINSSQPAWVTLRKYLAENGKYLALFALEDDVFEFMSMNNPNIPYMLLCRTATADHAVVCVNDSVTHDPNNSKSEIIGKHSIGFWIVGIIGEV